MEIDEDIYEGLGASLFPVPDIVQWKEGQVASISLTTTENVSHYATNLFKFIVCVALLPIAFVYSMAKYAVFLIKGKTEMPIVETQGSILKHFGFATSMFQDSGLGTGAAATKLKGISDWNQWLNPERIEGTEDKDYKKFFFDVLRNPEPFISLLKEMNVNAHRFSLEWAVIAPENGKIDIEAVGLYRNFIRQLQVNGIEPYVTLHHFVCPEWFSKEGGFEKLENVEIFKEHALQMMELFPEITYWMPFNEINVDGLQKAIRGVYPPGEVGNIALAGKMMRHMLIAHCQIYGEAKEKWEHLQIGSSHQWLKFEPLEGNPLESAVCYYLSKICHYACFNFFKTGQFSMDIPLKANVQFEIPNEEFQKAGGFSDFMGVQWYGYPRLKLGFNGGAPYPGFGINNIDLGPLGGLTFGSTAPKGERTMSFGPGMYPESLEQCLQEAESLGKPLVISEWGCDAKSQGHGEREFKLNFEAQKEFYERCLPIFERHSGNIQAMFTWTIAQDDLEWDRGDFPMLGTIKIIKDKERNMVGSELSPAAKLMQEVFARKRCEIANPQAA